MVKPKITLVSYPNIGTRLKSSSEAVEANKVVQLMANPLLVRVSDQLKTIAASFESKLDSGLNELRIELKALDVKLDAKLNPRDPDLNIWFNAIDAKGSTANIVAGGLSLHGKRGPHSESF